MSENSKIEWTTHTFNPVRGCTKISPGCANCYAERMSHRNPGVLGAWEPGAARVIAKEAYWSQPVKWNRDAALAGVRPRVFCASLADWLDPEWPVSVLARLLALIHATPSLDWLLLTKRPENWLRQTGRTMELLSGAKLQWLRDWRDAEAPLNVWIGVSVEDQARADKRIPALLSIPARVRFLSCEPLLGPVRLPATALGTASPPRQLDWVICGGESGPGARPMHPDWARDLRDQCAAADVPFFFKQWGEHLHERVIADGLNRGDFRHPIVQCPITRIGSENFFRPGKKSAGRLLDGIEHNAMPR